MTAVRITIDYVAGYFVFGVMYWFLNDILVTMQDIATTGDVYNYANYIWAGSLILYMVFGTFWFLSRLKEWDIEKGRF